AVEKLLQDYAKYANWENPIATKRLAAARITIRPQNYMPHASDVEGKTASVVIKRQNGNTETYNIPWVSTGTPIEVGPVPSPKAVTAKAQASLPAATDQPDYMKELLNAQWSGLRDAENLGLNNLGSRTPIFINVLTPAATGFTRRLGGATADF